MRLNNYLNEGLQDTGDTGKKGKQFENYFNQALDMVGLKYISNSSTGAVWDIKSVGDDWKRIVNDTDINIKLSGTKWLFGSTYLTKLLPWDEELPEDFDKTKYENKVKRFLNKIDIPSTIFLKPKTKDIEQQIIDAVKDENIEQLDKIFVKKNFQAEKLTKQYDVRILTRDNKITSIAIDKGSKVFMRSEKPRKMGGSYIVAFRTPTAKLSKVDKSVKKD